MKVGISSPITISKFVNYLCLEYHNRAVEIEGLKASAVDALVLGLLQKGHSVSIYTLSERVNNMEILKGERLTIFVNPLINRKWWRIFGVFTYKAIQIKNCIEADNIKLDLIHAHWTYEYAIGTIWGNKHIPVFVTVRDWIPAILRYKNFGYYYIIRYFLDFYVFSHKNINFIANSQYLSSLIKQRWKIEANIIPNAVSNSYIATTTITKQHKIFNIISISTTIDKRKNIESLIYAFSKFNALHENSTLVLVGNDFIESHPKVKKWKSDKLLKNVLLKGYIKHNDLIDILDNSDLLVHPSLEESFGNTLIEAMARKIPVIAGKNSGAVPFVL
ncbi:hypothetical protein FACS189438_0470 [Bacteroidia bacterium]|nr:hypothetical protein FACS189438_0470 [Bacteroidia bacterium]